MEHQIDRATIESAIHSYIRDPLELAERWYRTPRPLLDCPYVLLGTTGRNADYFYHNVAHRLNVVGIIDNRRIGEIRMGVRIGGDDDLISLAKSTPDLVAVNVTWNPHFFGIEKRLALHRIAPWALFEIFGLEQPESYMRGLAHSVIDDADLYFRLADRVPDMLSKQTVYRYMLYRLTGDLYQLHEVVQPWEEQFFAHSFLNYDDNEVVVDGGAFDGDTARFFLKASRGQYKRIYAFEPDPANFARLARFAETQRDIIPIQKGLSNRNDTVRFISGEGHGSRITGDQGNTSIEVCRLDDSVKERVTYIKLDIEGAELEALQGARGIIERDAPRLGVALYHKPDDAVDIIRFVEDNFRHNTLYFRHHTPDHYDTTLFSIPSC